MSNRWHTCVWQLHPDQNNTGTIGVRIYCNVKKHELVVTEELLGKYL